MGSTDYIEIVVIQKVVRNKVEHAERAIVKVPKSTLIEALGAEINSDPDVYKRTYRDLVDDGDDSN